MKEKHSAYVCAYIGIVGVALTFLIIYCSN